MGLADLIQERFGVETAFREDPLVTQFEVTPTLILPHNPNRLSVLILNLGTQIAYLGFSNNVSATKGFYLTPNGGYYQSVWDKDFILLAAPMWGIAIGGVSACHVIEVYEV